MRFTRRGEGTLGLLLTYKSKGVVNHFFHASIPCSISQISQSVVALRTTSKLLSLSHISPSTSTDANLKGGWVPSNVTVGTIEELQSMGYIPAAAKCHAPALSETNRSDFAIPTPKDGEWVVFIPHFIQGLGFPLHPFARALMFYDGLDFHHLATNAILHIATFITICEAFLRVKPHFGLWLKIFSFKPKSSGSQLAKCGGAMISKLPKVR